MDEVIQDLIPINLLTHVTFVSEGYCNHFKNNDNTSIIEMIIRIYLKMDILSLRLFIRIADLKSISASARDLQLSPASASTRLAKLEEDLGFRLFNRTTRAVSLTTDGAAFLPFAQQTIEALEAGLHAINGQGADDRDDFASPCQARLGECISCPFSITFTNDTHMYNLICDYQTKCSTSSKEPMISSFGMRR
jgi:molybdenum-dependent DNA-binding transcriptional regulator ModE